MPSPSPFHIAAFALGLVMIGNTPLLAELSLIGRDPPINGTGICADTPLSLTFADDVVMGEKGLLRIIRTRDGTVVEELDVAKAHHTLTLGTRSIRYEPFRIDGMTLTIQPGGGVLASEAGEEFSIVIEAGLVRSADGVVFAGIKAGEWRFTTRAALPKGRTRLVVAPDQSGDFRTLQGAVDYVPEDNFEPFEIHLRNGTYDSITYLGPGRNHIRLTGEDRKKTILAGRNNDRMNPERMERPFLSVDADDVTIENLTIHNTTPKGGSQAEALRLEGQRCTLRNCDFFSYQDTLLLNGRVYVADCLIEGDVDFIWGHGTTFFERCELKALHDGYLVTSRNPADKFGFVFSHCKLTAAPEVKKNWLARIDADRFPHSAVAFIHCQMGPHIPAEGWLIAGKDAGRLRFLEFNSTSPNGQPLDISRRHPASRQLTAAEAADLSDPNQVLANRDAWKPRP